MNIHNWEPQTRDVGYLIVEMLAEKDPTAQMEFYPVDICKSYGSRLKRLWGCRTYQETVAQKFRRLLAYKELEQPSGRRTPYRLAKSGRLFLLLSLHQRHKAAGHK